MSLAPFRRLVPARAFTNAKVYPMGAAGLPPAWAVGGLGRRAPAAGGVGHSRGGASGNETGAPWLRTAEAILWEGDTLLAVGAEADVLREARRVKATLEDVGGRVVLPGFVDAHMHFLHAGLVHMRPDLRGAKGLEDCMARVTAWLRANPGPDAVTGEGWDESSWPERVRPTRGDLDKACDAAGQPGRPLVLRRMDGHIAVANSAALPTLRRRWDDDSRVDMQTGILLEEASLYLNEALPAPAALLDAAVVEACRIAAEKGVTAVGDYSQAPFRAALQRAAVRGTLTVRVASSIYVQQLEAEVQQGFRTGRRGLGTADEVLAPREGSDGVVPGRDGGASDVGGTSAFLKDGGLKVFLDGSLGAHTAALREAYFDASHRATAGHHGKESRRGEEAGGAVEGAQPGRGRLNWSDIEVQRFFARADTAGIQVHAHAIGDAAIDQGLAAFAVVAARAELEAAGWGANALRHRFEHYEIVHDAQMAETAELGIVASSQPNFVGEWSRKGGMYEARLGDRFSLNNRFQAMKRAGIPVAFGSDGMPFGPLVGIQAAVDHPDEAERMAPLEAVWHYTWMSAWSLHWENLLGSLEPGKKADLVLLEETDLGGPPGTWRIRETVVGGTTRHSRGASGPIDGHGAAR